MSRIMFRGGGMSDKSFSRIPATAPLISIFSGSTRNSYSTLYGLSLLGHCLMSNHVHRIAVPGAANSLAQALKHAHGRCAHQLLEGSSRKSVHGAIDRVFGLT
jgi:hypothetical protein